MRWRSSLLDLLPALLCGGARRSVLRVILLIPLSLLAQPPARTPEESSRKRRREEEVPCAIGEVQARPQLECDVTAGDDENGPENAVLAWRVLALLPALKAAE